MQTANADQVIIRDVVPTNDKIRWFSSSGCVIRRAEMVEVLVDGMVIGSYGRKEVEVRNLLLVGLAQNSKVKMGKLASAFGLTAEMLRLLRRRFEADGLDGVRPSTTKRGRKSVVTPRRRRQLCELFESGMSSTEAFVELGREAGLSYRVVRRVRREWGAKREVAAKVPAEVQLEIAEVVGGEVARPEPDEASEAPRAVGSADVSRAAEAAADVRAPAATEDTVFPSESQAPRSGGHVRHAGSWLLVAMAHAMGLHAALARAWPRSRRWRERLRVVVDAVVVALGIGQRCVEGIRRLQTPGSEILLRTSRVPSASWARRVLKTYVEDGGVPLAHLAMTQAYLERCAGEGDGAVVLYIDNHLRPYTGRHTIRKGWRMQDKQVRPGVTDVYVHDEDGRPVYRLDVPSNDGLTTWLTPVMQILRAALGESQRILVAFDRGGAFPEQLAELRDEGFEFVTYERRPYQNLSASLFTDLVTVDGETIGVHESRLKNLGHGRGRVRRIALRMPEGQQVNLLAVSEEQKERLIEVMLGRWVQENGFKHGNERWGINQLDRRRVEAYPPDAVIPNPARRRLDNALRLARHREGDARNQLARMNADHPRRTQVERDLAEALAEQEALEALRPQVPTHAPLKETELKDKLVYHKGAYKTLVDTIRIACANVESELAVVLASHLRRPAEAKKVLANLFSASGKVQVNGKSITVTLEPAGNRDEQEAFQQLLHVVNRWRLTLPGDAKTRPLRFRSQIS